MTTKITVKPSTLAPYASPYNGKIIWPVLYIDGTSEKAVIDNADPGHGTPARDFHGHSRTITLADDMGNLPAVQALEELLNGSEAQDLLRRIYDGASSDWDGSNFQGRYDADANDALAELEELIQGLPSETWAVWQADEWYQHVSAAELEIDAWTTDEEIEAQAAEEENYLFENGNRPDVDHIILEGAREYLADLRAQARNEIDDDISLDEPGYRVTLPVEDGCGIEVQLLTPHPNRYQSIVAYRISDSDGAADDWRVGTLEDAYSVGGVARRRRRSNGAWITLADAAAFAGVSVQAISQRISTGRLASRTDSDAPTRQGRKLVWRSEV